SRQRSWRRNDSVLGALFRTAVKAPLNDYNPIIDGSQHAAIATRHVHHRYFRRRVGMPAGERATDHRRPGITGRDDDSRRQATPTAANEVRRCYQGGRHTVEVVVAPA